MSRLGTLLFTSVTLLTISSSSSSIFSSYILKPFSNMFNLRKRKISSQNAGDLIIHGTSRWESNFWRYLSSSPSENHDCELEVVNNANEVVIFCWIDFDCVLHHFSPINDRSIRDGSVSNRHMESTSTNHVFVCIKSTPNLPRHVSDIDPKDFIFSYRPTLRNCVHRIDLKQNSKSGKFEVTLRCELTTEEDEEVVDTSNKIYLTREICGFTIRYESDVFERTPELEACMNDDLRFVCLLLPDAAREKLQTSTPFWLNTNISYGPKRKPIIGHTACFHPGSGWLKKMGMNPAKCGGVEIYSASDYVKARSMWGTGGLLLHELCHAYHFKHCPDGYDCRLILEAYSTAMVAKRYDCVAVHGPQGAKGPIKAYACANCMEFFAELSVAFLYNHDINTALRDVDARKAENGPVVIPEYNKWFPHNASQLKSQDPATYEVLKNMWLQNNS